LPDTRSGPVSMTNGSKDAHSASVRSPRITTGLGYEDYAASRRGIPTRRSSATTRAG
jgi:hypothetical protein